MIERVEVLERKLMIAKEANKIKDFFDNSRCPVCGEKAIEVDISVKNDGSVSYGYATVKCKKCGMFNYRHDINSMDAYNWNYNGSSELNMLRVLKSNTSMYLK